MAENHIAKRTINYSKVFWVLSVIFLIILIINLTSGIILWVLLLLSSIKTLFMLLFSLLIFALILIQIIIIIIRYFNPEILKNYNKKYSSGRFVLSPEEEEELNKRNSKIAKMTSQELQFLLEKHNNVPSESNRKSQIKSILMNQNSKEKSLGLKSTKKSTKETNKSEKQLSSLDEVPEKVDPEFFQTADRDMEDDQDLTPKNKPRKQKTPESWDEKDSLNASGNSENRRDSFEESVEKNNKPNKKKKKKNKKKSKQNKKRNSKVHPRKSIAKTASLLSETKSHKKQKNKKKPDSKEFSNKSKTNTLDQIPKQDSYEALKDETLFPSNSRESNLKEKKIDKIYDKYYDLESEKLSDKSFVDELKNFHEEDILDENFDYKFNKTNPFYRKLDLNDYVKKESDNLDFKQLI
jgi:membrane protein implicated in regulation of membrane protease activity